MSKRDDNELNILQAQTDVDSMTSDAGVKVTPHQEGNFPGTSFSSSPSLVKQIVGGGVSALVQVGLGMVAGYSGVTIPQLTNSTLSEVVLDQHQVALFSSLIYLAAAIGCLIGVIPTVKFGQRITMLICLPILFGGWMALAFSSTVWMIQTSRFLIGLTIGVTESASYQYTTEIAHSAIRGQMVGALDTLRGVGILLVYALGNTRLTWQEISLVCGCTTVPPAILGLLFLPNSPRWLATRGRLEEASQSLLYYRGSHYDISAEMTTITNQLDDMGRKESGISHQLILMMKGNILKIVSFLSVLLLAVQFTGNIVMVAYFVPIFEMAEVNMNSYTSAIIVGSIRVSGTICSLIFVDYVGRRPALIVSFFICGLSLTSLGVFFYLKSQHGDTTYLNWLPLASLVVYTFFSCIGHPTLNLVRGELLPTSVRSAAMPLLCCIFFGGMFLASQTYPIMTDILGESGVFWTYAAVCIFMVITTVIFIPETRDRNLENIDLGKLKIGRLDKNTYVVEG